MTHSASPVQAWGAVFAMSLAAFALVSSEFMPVSLLTPIATDLQVTEGQAGQALSISGAFAVLTSLLIPYLAGNLDRKRVILCLTFLMLVSSVIVTFAPNYTVFMLGRALIGVAVGGFWSLSVSVAMRLVDKEHIPRALAILNAGNALALVLAAPLGSFLGGLVGWRWAFFCLIPVAALTLAWKWISLPTLKAEPPVSGSRNLLKLLARPAVALGMAAMALFFMGEFALFTYLRPFLEQEAHLSATGLSLILLLMGVAGFFGTLWIGAFINRGLYGTLAAIPALMAVIALLLMYVGHSMALNVVLLGIWGLIATATPVGWWTWLARTLPKEAEAGGGLMVAVIQLAIMLGATLGGVLFDVSGYQAAFGLGALLLVAASVVTLWAARVVTQAASSHPAPELVLD